MKRRIKLSAAALLYGLALFIALWLQDLVPHPWALGLLVCLILVLGAFAVISTVLKFDDITTCVQWFPAGPVDAAPAFGAAEPRLRKLRKMLAELDVDAAAGAELHETLNVLVHERLRARGISQDHDPEEWAQALGQELERYLHGPPPERLTLDTLSQVITRIEEL